MLDSGGTAVVVGAIVIGGPISGVGKVVSDKVGTSSEVALTSVCPSVFFVLVEVDSGTVSASVSLTLSGSSVEPASSISSASMNRSTGSSKDVSLQGCSIHRGTGKPAAFQVATAS